MKGKGIKSYSKKKTVSQLFTVVKSIQLCPVKIIIDVEILPKRIRLQIHRFLDLLKWINLLYSYIEIFVYYLYFLLFITLVMLNTDMVISGKQEFLGSSYHGMPTSDISKVACQCRPLIWTLTQIMKFTILINNATYSSKGLFIFF